MCLSLLPKYRHTVFSPTPVQDSSDRARQYLTFGDRLGSESPTGFQRQRGTYLSRCQNQLGISEPALVLTRSREIGTGLSPIHKFVKPNHQVLVLNAGRFRTTVHVPLGIVSGFLDVANHLSGQQIYTIHVLEDHIQ